MYSSGSACFASLTPHFYGYWFFFPQDWGNILWLLQTACLTCQSCSVATCHSFCLPWLLSYFHFSAFNLSVHCILPHLICFFWAFLILLGPFQFVYCLEVTQLSVWDTSVHPYKSLFPGRQEQHFPVSEYLQWSCPTDSSAECGLV